MNSLEQRALKGEDAAWNVLIARHDRRVWATLLAMGADPDLASDVLQETWVKLVLRARRGELTELRLPGLATAQARFIYLHRLEGRKVTVSPDDRESGVELVDHAADIERSTEDRQTLRRALTALDSVPPRKRDLFTSVFEEGLTAPEASARFGITVQRVRQTLCEVREALRAALGVER